MELKNLVYQEKVINERKTKINKKNHLNKYVWVTQSQSKTEFHCWKCSHVFIIRNLIT